MLFDHRCHANLGISYPRSVSYGRTSATGQSLDMKETTRPTETATRIAYRIPGGEWKRKTLRKGKNADAFIDRLIDDGAEIRWEDAR
jgi:hypothetical protein